ncbi:MAG TPA: c-type cytochrome [Steroidobacteraceae bacterium]|nr:c-type cytochrome [Steroidobacteraceae bacterium]
MNRTLLAVGATFVALLVLGAIVVGSGVYNVAADDPHWSFVHGILDVTRERSIAVHAGDIEVPRLDEDAMARRGAGNYAAMCAGCHLAPGAEETELSVGLYPAPPNLAKHEHVDSAEAFWVIKHGLKATAMPAWGKRMDDAYIWDLVAFLRKLPSLTAEQYKAEVAASGGHSHGGGESAEHSHEEGEEHEEDQHSHAGDAGEEQHPHSDSDSATHSHADGTEPAREAAAGSPVRAVQALHEAMSAGDAKRVQDVLDAKVLIMEGGNVERSRAEYAGHHLPADLKFMQSINYKLERQTGDTVGDLAWVASEARLNGTREGKAIDMVSTESLVLKKAAAGWKVVHIHWSSRAAKQ